MEKLKKIIDSFMSLHVKHEASGNQFLVANNFKEHLSLMLEFYNGDASTPLSVTISIFNELHYQHKGSIDFQIAKTFYSLLKSQDYVQIGIDQQTRTTKERKPTIETTVGNNNQHV